MGDANESYGLNSHLDYHVAGLSRYSSSWRAAGWTARLRCIEQTPIVFFTFAACPSDPFSIIMNLMFSISVDCSKSNSFWVLTHQWSLEIMNNMIVVLYKAMGTDGHLHFLPANGSCAVRVASLTSTLSLRRAGRSSKGGVNAWDTKSSERDNFESEERKEPRTVADCRGTQIAHFIPQIHNVKVKRILLRRGKKIIANTPWVTGTEAFSPWFFFLLLTVSWYRDCLWLVWFSTASIRKNRGKNTWCFSFSSV